jgi:hypothetical protein
MLLLKTLLISGCVMKLNFILKICLVCIVALMTSSQISAAIVEKGLSYEALHSIVKKKKKAYEKEKNLSDLSYKELYTKFTKGKKVFLNAKELTLTATDNILEGDYSPLMIHVSLPSYDKKNYISKITILTTKNQINFVLSAKLSKKSNIFQLNTHVQPADSQEIVVLCETNDGKVFEKRVYINIELLGDCKDFDLKGSNVIKSVTSITEFKYKRGDTVKVGQMMFYPGVVGYMHHMDVRVVKERYIKKGTIYFNNEKIAIFRYGAHQNKSSLVQFPFKIISSGIFKTIWENNKGDTFESEVAVEPY